MERHVSEVRDPSRWVSKRARGLVRVTVVATVLPLLVAVLAVTRSASALEESHIQQIEGAVVKYICAERDWLDCWGEQPSNCEKIIAPVAKTCLEQYLPAVKESVQYDQARTIGLKIITCLNQEFGGNRPFGRKTSPECLQVPQHLQ
jgi:hypothetical protein